MLRLSLPSCRPFVRMTAVVCACLFAATALSHAEEKASKKPFTVVVMDPLAAPLACDCVEGYAQRKYETLQDYLKTELGRDVKVVFGAALKTALEGEAKGRADLIIGKHSVVLADAKTAKLKVSPVASLTGTDGSVVQTGLLVVRKNDPAKKVADLKDYRFFFGPAECDEKSAAPMALLKKHGVKIPKKIERSEACSDAATKLMELDESVRAAAIISSYAQPLLEGCGTIKKGDLRVVGESKPVPFVTAFINQSLPKSQQDEVATALLLMHEDPTMLVSLETKRGFVKFDKKILTAEKKKRSRK